MTKDEWRDRLRAFYAVASAHDRKLFDDLEFWYSLETFPGWLRGDGELPREDQLEDRRAEYAKRAERIRRCATFQALAPEDREVIERVAFTHPTTKLGVRGRPAAPRLPLYTPTYREICELAGWPEVTSDGLHALLRALPGRRITFCRLDTREYITDGLMPARAFFSPTAAQLCADWLAIGRGPFFKYYIHREPLLLDAKAQIRLADIEGVQWPDWYFKLLNAQDEEWTGLAKLILGPNGCAPDFERLAAEAEFL